MLKIPFYRASIESPEIEAVTEVLRSGWLTTGPRVREFEAAFSTYIGQAHSVAVNSCTAALHLALEAIGVKPGDGVIVPTMTFAASAEVVRYFDARPLLVDCREDDFNLDVEQAAAVVCAERTAGRPVVAVVAVHYGGQICDMPAVHRLARAHGLRVIEDAAHCCPAFFREAGGPWQSVGAGSDVSCFSFYANKTITTGEGGMACTNQPDLADRMRVMALHGISKDAWKRFTAEGSWYYEIVAPGFKYNLTDIAGALGLVQLRKAERLHQCRTRLAERYVAALADITEVIPPRQQPDRVHSWHLYVIRLRLDRLTINRADFITKLKESGIGCSVHWMPLHMHPYYRQKYGFVPEAYPTAARLFQEIISLPLFPDMTESEVDFVAGEIRRIAGAHRR
ncbi:MAG: UDP-4-amino-4-deoxy-L-arabinose--oxoglutarate aminotransferase [Verrucomicrobiota bacterium]|jgi:perosamine synthetase